MQRRIQSRAFPLVGYAEDADSVQEANESIISLDDDNPAVVDAMLCYIYTTDYDEVKAAETIEGAPLVFNVHVHIVADKYDIAALTKLAESKFAKHAMAKGAWKLGGFAQAIEQVYAGDADRHENLRKTLVEVSSQHVNELYKEEFGAGFRQMALKFPPFSSALLAEVPSRSKADKNDVRYRCPSCKRTYATRKFADDVVGYCPGCSHSKFGEHWKK